MTVTTRVKQNKIRDRVLPVVVDWSTDSIFVHLSRSIVVNLRCR